jgi:quaternary ammonium compound-resistance protein SugE
VILVAAGMLEAVWATALGASDGFKKKVPTAVFAVSIVLSLVGLATAMNQLPTGTAYAVWVGLGAVLTAILAIIRRQERLTTARAVFLLLLIGSVIGLKVIS